MSELGCPCDDCAKARRLAAAALPPQVREPDYAHPFGGKGNPGDSKEARQYRDQVCRACQGIFRIDLRLDYWTSCTHCGENQPRVKPPAYH